MPRSYINWLDVIFFFSEFLVYFVKLRLFPVHYALNM
jgi:hypothetical protein